MSRRGHSRREVDVGSDVTLVGRERRPGMQADAYLNWTGRKRIGEGAGCAQRSRRGREGEEERRPLGYPPRRHLLPSMPRGSHAGARQARRRTAQRRGHAGAGLSLNIGEEERDRARGEIAPHAAIMRQRFSVVNPHDPDFGGRRSERIVANHPRRRPARPGCRSWQPQRRDPGGRGRRKRRCGGRHSGEPRGRNEEPRSPRSSGWSRGSRDDEFVSFSSESFRARPRRSQRYASGQIQRLIGRQRFLLRRKMATCQAGPTSRRVSGTRPCSRAIRSIARRLSGCAHRLPF